MIQAVSTGHPAGDLAALMSLAVASPLHRAWSLESAMRLFPPPIAQGTYRLWADGGRIVAACTWACMSPEALARYQAGQPLQPADWRSGELPVVIDLIAPHGHCRSVMRELQRLFGRRKVTWMRHKRGWKEGWAHGVDPR